MLRVVFASSKPCPNALWDWAQTLRQRSEIIETSLEIFIWMSSQCSEKVGRYNVDGYLFRLNMGVSDVYPYIQCNP